MYHNWIESFTHKRINWITRVGIVSGRTLYCLTFEDGTEEDWFIDFVNEIAEKY